MAASFCGERGNWQAGMLLVPEVVEQICSFLPTSDLISCTYVNSFWESEARKHLLERKEINLNDARTTNYLQVMRVRSNCHERIHFQSDAVNFSQYYESIMSTAANFYKVKYLTVPWFLEGERYFESIEKFPNLTSLSLYPRLTQETEESITTILQEYTPGKHYSFSKIRRLGIQLTISEGQKYEKIKEYFPLIMARIAPIFPNVTTFEYGYANGSNVEYLLRTNSSPFPNLKALILVQDLQGSDMTPRFERSFSRFQIMLTRLEFNTTFESHGFGPRILTEFAATLKFLHIIDVISLPDMYLLLIPCLPELQVFKFSQTTIASPCDFLQFETKDVANGTILMYQKQFPQLRSLIFIEDYTKDSAGVTDEKSFIEFLARMMCSPFLALNNGACMTLTKLDMPFPQRDEFKLGHLKGEAKCAMSNFVDRVNATFPNVKYGIFEKENE